MCLFGDGSFGMTAFDMETANRFNAPFLAVIGNNSAMNQIRYGQIAKYGPQRGDIGNKLGDVEFSKFAHMLDGHGEEVREASQIGPALSGRGCHRQDRPLRGGQCLDRPQRICAGDEESDDVQIGNRAVGR
jgi:thiamine pyrophosphate-dependent acetolactate synthase large subunit-like protein